MILTPILLLLPGLNSLPLRGVALGVSYGEGLSFRAKGDVCASAVEEPDINRRLLPTALGDYRQIPPLRSFLTSVGMTSDPIATYNLAGRSIAVTLPGGGEVPETQPSVKSGDWNYILDRRGTPILKTRGMGGWGSVAELYNEAKAKWTPQTPVWHVKVILFTKVNIEDKTSDGVLRLRRSELGRNGTDAALQDIGRFLVAAEAAAGGNARVVADVQVDDDTIFADARKGYGKVIDKEFVDRVVSARTNTGGFEADDKIFRGPFQSVFVLHAGMTPGLIRSRVFGAPVSSFSVFDSLPMMSPDLPTEMLSCWSADLVDRIAPTSMPRRVESLNVTGALASALDTAPWIPQILADTPATVSSTTWADAAKNPFRLLSRVALPISETGPGIASVGVSVWKAAGNTYIASPVGMAEFVASSAGGLQILGWGLNNGSPVIVFQAPSSTPLTPIEALALAGKVQHAEMLNTEVDLFGGLITLPTANFVTQIGTDADHGRTLTVTEIGEVRSGHGLLPTEGEAKGSILRFDVKSTSKDPIAILAAGPKGPVEVILGSLDPSPSDGPPDTTKTIAVRFKPDGTWQTIQVDLSATATSGTALYIVPPVNSPWFERRQLEPVQYTFANARWAAAIDGSPTPISDDVADAVLRARATLAANQKALLPMLEDRTDIVALNAAARFQKIKAAEAEPALIKLASGPNPRVSEEAMKALGFQGTETAKVAIRNILDNSPYVHNRLAAAEVVAEGKLPGAAGAISRLLIVPSWQARLRATELIAAQPGEDSKLILVTFFNQDEPEVRLSAVNLEDPKLDLPCRRFEWYSVNDESDAVRAACYLQLLRSPVAKYRDEGRKGISDDSAYVRLEVLRAIDAKPVEADRAAFRQAVTDRSPEVRAEALRGFARLPGAVSAEEIANSFNDGHREVSLALIQLAIAKHVQLPSETVARLKLSGDPEVATAAKGLGN